ncbi:MAG: hypothetical protein P1U41_08805, partial [Vicingaceae bacterium]|nr:hypothetical protein [Vicingaceae bacterium]
MNGVSQDTLYFKDGSEVVTFDLDVFWGDIVYGAEQKKVVKASTLARVGAPLIQDLGDGKCFIKRCTSVMLDSVSMTKLGHWVFTKYPKKAKKSYNNPNHYYVSEKVSLNFNLASYSKWYNNYIDVSYKLMLDNTEEGLVVSIAELKLTVPSHNGYGPKTISYKEYNRIAKLAMYKTSARKARMSLVYTSSIPYTLSWHFKSFFKELEKHELPTISELSEFELADKGNKAHAFNSKEYMDYVKYKADAEKVETQYMRPTITNVFIKSNKRFNETLFNSINSVEIPNKFDRLDLDEPLRNVSVDMKKYGEEITVFGVVDSRQKIKMQRALHEKLSSSTSRNVVAKWWNRDENGDFNSDLVVDKALYSASNIDFEKTKDLAHSRLGLYGEQLINKSYIIVYEIRELWTNKTNNQGDVVAQGYHLDYSAHLYKLDFNENVANEFYNKMWSDSANHKYSNTKKFNHYDFPLKYVDTKRGSKSFLIRTRVFGITGKKTINKDSLINLVGPNVVEEVFGYFDKRVPDFKVKTIIASNNQRSAELVINEPDSSATQGQVKQYEKPKNGYRVEVFAGAKEGLRIDDKYKAYMIIQDTKGGGAHKETLGVLRVSRVAKNNGKTNDITKASRFRQHGGKKLQPGMLIER